MFQHLLTAITTMFRRPAMRRRLETPPLFELPDALVERYRYRAPRVTKNLRRYRQQRKIRMQIQRESRKRNRAA
jgi:hypothetical protein